MGGSPDPPPPVPVETPEEIAAKAEETRRKAATSAADSIALSRSRASARSVVTGLFIPGVSGGY